MSESSPDRRGTLSLAILIVTVSVVGIMLWLGTGQGLKSRRVAESLATGDLPAIQKALGDARELGAAAIGPIISARQTLGAERSQVYTAALAQIAGSNKESMKAVHDLLSHPDPKVQVMAAGFWQGDTASRNALVSGLGSSDAEIRFEAAFKLGSIEEGIGTYRAVVDVLIGALNDNSKRFVLSDEKSGAMTVGDLALIQLCDMTGHKDRAALEAWWKAPETRSKTNAQLLLDAADRDALEFRLMAPGLKAKTREALEKLAKDGK